MQEMRVLLLASQCNILIRLMRLGSAKACDLLKSMCAAHAGHADGGTILIRLMRSGLTLT